MRKTYFFKTPALPTQFNLARTFEQSGIFKARSDVQADFSEKNLCEDAALTTLENKEKLSSLLQEKPYYPETLSSNACQQHVNHYELDRLGSPIIIKPSQQNNGSAIRIEDKQTLLNQPLPKGYILQRYIQPDLIEGRKYSLRLLGVLDKQGHLYLYQKGYMNLALKPYVTLPPYDNDRHLTNEHQGARYQGEQRILDNWSKSASFYAKANAIIKDVLTTFEGNDSYVNEKAKISRYSFWGFDFMFDNEDMLWFLEANHAPCFPKSELHPLYPSLYYNFWQGLVTHIILPTIDNQDDSIMLENTNFIKIEI